MNKTKDCVLKIDINAVKRFVMNMLDSFLPIMKAVVYMAYVEKLFFCIMYIYWKEINMNSETKYSILDLSLSNVHSTTRVKTDSQYKTPALKDFNITIKMISPKRILCYFLQLTPPPFRIQLGFGICTFQLIPIVQPSSTKSDFI